MSNIHKFTIGDTEYVIFLNHVSMVSYTPNTNTVSITLNSGNIINLTTTTETLYETLVEKISKLSRPEAI